MRSVQRLAQSGPFRLPPSLSGRRLAVRRFSSFSPLAEEPKTRKPRAKRSASTKTASQTFNFDDLPTSLPGKDGRVQLPLQTWDARLGTWQSIGNEPSYDLSPSVASKRAARETKEVAEVKTANWYDAEVEKAIDEHRIPDTKLGREIYENMLRFSGCIVLTRVGKFYESYFEPAEEVSKLLGIKCTRREYKVRVPGDPKASVKKFFNFTGFPYYVLDKFLKILIDQCGHTVVIVDEMHAEEKTNGNITRRVGRVVTPGTLIDESWIQGDESRYLLAVTVSESPADLHPDEQGRIPGRPLSLAYTDVSTGEFFTKDTDMNSIEDELARIAPREIVLDRSLQPIWEGLTNLSATEEGKVESLLSLLKVLGAHVSFADPLRPPEYARAPGATPRPVPSAPTSLEGVSILLLRHHLEFALRESMPDLIEPQFEPKKDYMHIDAATLAALEIRHAIRPGALISERTGRERISPLSVAGTLLSVIDRTVSSAGHRLLVRTLTQPSTSLKVINARLALVQAFVDRGDLRDDLQRIIKGLPDIMRLMQKYKANRGEAFDLVETLEWIRGAATIRQTVQRTIQEELRLARSGNEEGEGVKRLRTVVDAFTDISGIADLIEGSIDINVLRTMTDGEEDVLADEDGSSTAFSSDKAEVRVIKDDRVPGNEWRKRFILPTYSDTMAQIHADSISAQQEMDKMHRSLAQQLGVTSDQLRLMDNKQGSYVHVTGSLNPSKIPHALARIPGGTKKSSKWAYNIWTSLAHKITAIEMKRIIAQNKAVKELCAMVADKADDIEHNSKVVDELDMSMGFAEVASNMGYTRPMLNESTEMQIKNGRHPSVESGLLSATRMFTPNSTQMSSNSHLHVITGPNQGGKSTFLRQNAIIAILAQSGSFVPADRCEMGIIDRVFSRVGARDDLYRDRSTFMLEMVETAAILQNATDRSLVIMDEIGRGTTLHAGMSIAYATLDYILKHIKCRTLFATHYHELASMLGHSGATPSVATPLTPGKGSSVPVPPARPGVEFWCTDAYETNGGFTYSYRIKPGVNFNSHAIKAAELAGMPKSFLETATSTLEGFQTASSPSRPSSAR